VVLTGHGSQSGTGVYARRVARLAEAAARANPLDEQTGLLPASRAGASLRGYCTARPTKEISSVPANETCVPRACPHL